MSYQQRPININRGRPPFQKAKVSLNDAAFARKGPQVVAYWTDQIRRAAHKITPAPGDRPCCDISWTTALAAARHDTRLPCTVAAQMNSGCPSAQLMDFGWDLACRKGVACHDDWIEFVLTFLEADVMLRRSGYAKRHMILRLRDVPLDLAQNARVCFLLKRAVVNGTGTEEFRAYKKLSRTLVQRNAMPDWRDWLVAQACGAVVAVQDLEHCEKARATALAHSKGIALRQLRTDGRSGPELGIVWPGLSTFACAQEDWNAPPEQVRRNAFYMLMALGPIRT